MNKAIGIASLCSSSLSLRGTWQSLYSLHEGIALRERSLHYVRDDLENSKGKRRKEKGGRRKEEGGKMKEVGKNWGLYTQNVCYNK